MILFYERLHIELANVCIKRTNGDGCASFGYTSKVHRESFYLGFFFFVFDIKLTFLKIIICENTIRIFLIDWLTFLTKYGFLFFTSWTYQLNHFYMIFSVRDIQLNICYIYVLHIFFDRYYSSFYVLHFITFSYKKIKL